MRFLEFMRTVLGLVAMLMAVVWYGALYVEIDLPSLVFEYFPALETMTGRLETDNRSTEIDPADGAASVLTQLRTHIVPALLLLIAIIALFVRRRKSNKDAAP
ncbi:MAG: hypothetical protein AAFW81_04905 [Pseudomonadota bacterium]